MYKSRLIGSVEFTINNTLKRLSKLDGLNKIPWKMSLRNGYMLLKVIK